MIIFKCDNCNSNKYKLIKWELKRNREHIGVYCYECDNWLKFISKDEEVQCVFCGMESKQLRPRKHKLTNREN